MWPGGSENHGWSPTSLPQGVLNTDRRQANEKRAIRGSGKKLSPAFPAGIIPVRVVWPAELQSRRGFWPKRRRYAARTLVENGLVGMIIKGRSE